jgi:hypothetical protein
MTNIPQTSFRPFFNAKTQSRSAADAATKEFEQETEKTERKKLCQKCATFRYSTAKARRGKAATKNELAAKERKDRKEINNASSYLCVLCVPLRQKFCLNCMMIQYCTAKSFFFLSVFAPLRLCVKNSAINSLCLHRVAPFSVPSRRQIRNPQSAIRN